MESLLLGASLGLAAGVSPGPLLTLIIATTLERGFLAGLRLALSPLVSDVPLVALCLWMLASVPAGFLTAIALAGGGYVVYLGAETVYGAWHPPAADATPVSGGRDLWRGAVVNVLNPHPWLFWLGVGGPQVVGLWTKSPPAAVGFMAAFYVCLLGSKIAVAWAIAKGRGRLDRRWYRILLAACGTLLVALGVLLVARGLAPAWGKG